MNYDWYPFYPRKFRTATLHLTLAQDGAYRRLIDEYMLIQGALPDDDAKLARIIGVDISEWMGVSEVVRAFFKPHSGKLIQKTCEEELHAQAMRTHSRRIKAKASADVRWKNHREMKQILANALPPHSERNADAMRIDATRQSKDKKEEEPVENIPATSLATALPAGALARSPELEQVSRKRPADVSKEELDALFERRREEKAKLQHTGH